MKDKKRIDYKNISKKMKRRYIPAIIIIVLLIITRQVIIEYQLNQNQDISKLINVAGRQRMLSQMISKDINILSHSENSDETALYLQELKEATKEWEQAQIELQKGNNEDTEKLYLEIEDCHEVIIDTANSVILKTEKGEANHDTLIEEMNIIEENEPAFLEGMENIVNEYENYAQQELDSIKNIEIILFWIILVVILFVVFFIFVPSEITIKKAFDEINIAYDGMQELFKTGQNILFLINEKTFEIIIMSEAGENILREGFKGQNKIKLHDALEFASIDKDEFVKQVMKEDKISQMEIIITKGENSLFFLLTTKKIKYLDEHSILISLFDITIQKNTEASMRKLTIKDKLTGLYNRYFLDEIINEEMERALRYNFQFSVFIMDLDLFKRINDTWGHPVGDIILKDTADIASKNLRRSDFLIRIGGEEFLLLMPHTNLKEAMIVADKIRKEIENLDHPIVGHYTASFGVAQWDKAESFKELYERADEALYKAKEKGRNRVISSKKRSDLQPASVQFEWKDEWSSGNKTIDEQHKELVDIANGFVFLSKPKSDAIEPIQKIDDLIKHMEYHFECEEGILKDSGYLGYPEHHRIHEKLIREIEELKESYNRGEVKVSAFFTFMLEEVVIGHMLDEDTKFFPYVKK